MSKEANNWTGCYNGGWQGLIVPEAFAHPAKFSYNLTEHMIGHAIRNGWITKGSVVADPFGGVGCGGIVAAYSDLVWIGCELEQKFVDLAKQNFELHRRKWEKLNCTQPVIIQGDSRKLCEVIAGADCVISSPPFQESLQSGDTSSTFKDKYPDAKTGGDWGQSYGSTPGQLGSMKSGQVDAVISSPPHSSEGLGHGGKPTRGANRKDDRNLDAMQEGYGQTPGNLGNLKSGDVDCVISSPPYEQTQGTGSGELEARKGRTDTTGEYGKAEGQLGNEQGDTFWHAAREIIQQCHQILKPGGHAIWVVKAFVRKGKIVDFPGDWERLCESVGFVTVCRHKAMLVKETTHNGLFEQISEKKERKSFFRRLAESKGSPRIDWEMVLCMRRKDNGME